MIVQRHNPAYRFACCFFDGSRGWIATTGRPVFRNSAWSVSDIGKCPHQSTGCCIWISGAPFLTIRKMVNHRMNRSDLRIDYFTAVPTAIKKGSVRDDSVSSGWREREDFD